MNFIAAAKLTFQQQINRVPYFRQHCAPSFIKRTSINYFTLKKFNIWSNLLTPTSLQSTIQLWDRNSTQSTTMYNNKMWTPMHFYALHTTTNQPYITHQQTPLLQWLQLKNINWTSHLLHLCNSQILLPKWWKTIRNFQNEQPMYSLPSVGKTSMVFRNCFHLLFNSFVTFLFLNHPPLIIYIFRYNNL